MPLGTRARAVLAGAVAAVLAVALGACSAPVARPVVPTESVPSQQAVAAAARTDARLDRLDVVQDRATASLVVLPKRSNGAVVLYLHGWSSDRDTLLSRGTSLPVLRALVAAGYTVVTADGDLKAWGDPASTADYRSVLQAAEQRYGLHEVFLLGESMGGLATMQLSRELPDVRAVAAWFPVCDLRTMHEARFQVSIARAWHGLSRAAVSPVVPGDVPLRVWASTDDTVVKASANAAVCVAEARRAGADAAWIRTRGDHGDSSNYDPPALLRFFDEHRTPTA